MSITAEQVLAMSYAEIMAAIKAPATGARMQELLRDRKVVTHVSQLLLEHKNREAEVDRQLEVATPPSTAELAAQAQEMVEATPAIVPEVVPPPPALPTPVPAPADYTAEDAAYKTEGVTVTRDASGKIIHLAQEYQVRDKDGTPIGFPTNLVAASVPELLGKQRIAHENATRAFHRLKRQKLQFTEKENYLLPADKVSEVAAKALEAQDAPAAIQVVRSLLDGEFKSSFTKLREKSAELDQLAIGLSFMQHHLYDFNPCEANQKMLGTYLREHGLDFTPDNLEAAFLDLSEQGSKLAPVDLSGLPVATRPAEPSANTPATATVAVTPAPALPAPAPAAAVTPPAVAQPTAAPANTPVVAATAPTPAASNSTPAARRPGVNGSLPPGSMSAHRPVLQDPGQARKEFMRALKAMTRPEMLHKLKTDPQFGKQLQAYGVKVN